MRKWLHEVFLGFGFDNLEMFTLRESKVSAQKQVIFCSVLLP